MLIPGFIGLIGVLFVSLPLVFLVIWRRLRNAASMKKDITRLLEMLSHEAAYAEAQASAPKFQCRVCFTPAINRCSQCKSVRYCSVKCQIIDWKQGHKDECQPPIDSEKVLLGAHMLRNAAVMKKDITRLLEMPSHEAAFAEAQASGPKFQCRVCFTPTTTRCRQCKSVRYCSVKCQIIDWKQGHKDECQPPIDSEKVLLGAYMQDLPALARNYLESHDVRFKNRNLEAVPSSHNASKSWCLESENEDGKLDIQNTGVSIVDIGLEEFDISALQVIKNEDLEELRELGCGTFGTVYHGQWRGTDVAIKRIKKSCFIGRSSKQERLTVEFCREAEILSKLHHPNVVAFYGVVPEGPGGTLATVMEYMVNGSLRHVLLNKDSYLDRHKRLIIAMDAAFGMEYLHSQNIVHFDLKCDNLLVNLKDPVRPICKVGDFGLSKIKRNTLVTGGVRGTLPWMAPELLNGSSRKVSEKVDVFSFGIILWEILTGAEPYADMHCGAIIGGIVSNTLRPPVPSYCDPEWKLLMEQCWAPDPVARPSFTEIARRLRIMSSACQTKLRSHHPPNQIYR